MLSIQSYVCMQICQKELAFQTVNSKLAVLPDSHFSAISKDKNKKLWPPNCKMRQTTVLTECIWLCVCIYFHTRKSIVAANTREAFQCRQISWRTSGRGNGVLPQAEGRNRKTRTKSFIGGVEKVYCNANEREGRLCRKKTLESKLQTIYMYACIIYVCLVVCMYVCILCVYNWLGGRFRCSADKCWPLKLIYIDFSSCTCANCGLN